jgi:uncharacterized protein (TIGR02246 family)
MFMHRVFSSAAFLAFVLGGCERRVGPAPLTDADRNAMRGLVVNFDKAVLAANWPAVVSVYTEDGILMPPNAPEVQGRAAMLKFFEGFPKITEFKQSVTEIEGGTDLVYVRGTYEMTMSPPGAKSPQRDVGKVLAVWRKQPDGSWLVSRVSWNPDLALDR